MHENIKLSIIVTTFNVEKYLTKCLDDCLNQTVNNFELIVVDDGSTDNTKSIILSYAEKDKRIRPILMKHNSPGGVATAANIGLNAARGDWIGFADGDDLFDPTMFQKLLNAAETSDADIAICKFKEYDSNEQIEYDPWDPHWNELEKFHEVDLTNHQNKLKFLKLNPVPWRKLYKRDLIEKNNIRFKECNYFFEDNSFHWFVTLSAKKVVFVNEALCYHRMNRIGQTMQANGSKLLGIYYQFDVIKEFLVVNNQYSDFKFALIEWLFGQTAWISEELDSKFRKVFFDVLTEKLRTLDFKDIKRVIRTGCSRKLASIIVAACDENYNIFELVLINKFSKPLSFNIRVKYYRHGLSFMFASPVKKINKFFFHRKNMENQIAGLHWEISEIRKLLELNAAFNEELLKELKKDKHSDNIF